MNDHSESPAILAAIKITGFRYLWLGQIFSQIASNSLTFVLALRLYNVTSSNTAVSMMFLIYGLSAMALGLVAGTIVDKLDSRRVLVVCDITRALVLVVFLFFSDNVATIYILTFVNSVITQFYMPAEAPTIPHLVPKNLVISANSLFSFTYYSSLAIGSILSGPILRIFGPVYVYIVLSVGFLIAAVMAARLPKIVTEKKSISNLLSYSLDYIAHRLIANIKEALNIISRSKSLSDAMILLLGTQVTIAILGTLGPGFADKLMRIDVRDSSIVIMGPAVLGIILGALTIGSLSRKIKPGLLIKTGIMSAGITLVLLAVIVRLSHHPVFSRFIPPQIAFAIAIILFFLLGVGNSMLDVPANSILQQQTSNESRGRIYGILSMGFGGVGMLPVVFSGFLADTVGVGTVILSLGILVTGYGIFRMKYNT